MPLKLGHEVRKVREYCFRKQKLVVWIERYIVFGIQNRYFCQLRCV